jgi:hypothetical protein
LFHLLPLLRGAAAGCQCRSNTSSITLPLLLV